MNKCINLIEEKVGKGDSKLWLDRDFHQLSDAIFEASQIRISLPTLKRLFGRKKTYNESYNPQAETKNALAIYLGYKNWHHFTLNQSTFEELTHELRKPEPVLFPQHTPASNEPTFQTPPIRYSYRKMALLGGILLAVILLFTFYHSGYRNTKYVYLFKGKHVTGQLPFTSVIAYDVSNIKDSAFVYFLGNGRKEYLPKNKHYVTGWYQLPGIFQAKLIVKDEVIDSLRIHVKSDDWVTVIRDSKHMKYERVSAVKDSAGVRYVSPEKARSAYNIEQYWVQHRHATDFDVDGDNLTFEVKAKSELQRDLVACNDISFDLQGEKRSLRTHFLNTGCTRWARLNYGELELKGNFEDLSAFGINLNHWRVFRLEVRNKQVKVLVDNQQVFTTRYNQPVGRIKLIELESLRSGAFDYVRLYNSRGQLVYTDEFNE